MATRKAKPPSDPPTIGPTLLFFLGSLSAAAALDFASADSDAAFGASLEVVLGVFVDVLEVDDAELEDVEVDVNVIGANVIFVYTSCNKRSVACPVKVVSTFVA